MTEQQKERDVVADEERKPRLSTADVAAAAQRPGTSSSNGTQEIQDDAVPITSELNRTKDGKYEHTARCRTDITASHRRDSSLPVSLGHDLDRLRGRTTAVG